MKIPNEISELANILTAGNIHEQNSTSPFPSPVHILDKRQTESTHNHIFSYDLLPGCCMPDEAKSHWVHLKTGADLYYTHEDSDPE